MASSVTKLCTIYYDIVYMYNISYTYCCRHTCTCFMDGSTSWLLASSSRLCYLFFPLPFPFFPFPLPFPFPFFPFCCSLSCLFLSQYFLHTFWMVLAALIISLIFLAASSALCLASSCSLITASYSIVRICTEIYNVQTLTCML